jgi:hypothetical protein
MAENLARDVRLVLLKTSSAKISKPGKSTSDRIPAITIPKTNPD